MILKGFRLDLRRATNSPNRSWPLNIWGGTGANRVKTPVFDPAAGTFFGVTPSVTITCATPSSTIYYTTDGSTPTTGSFVYSTPIAIASTTTLKAFATAAGLDDSPVRTGVYTISIAPANAIQMRDSSYLFDRAGDYIETRV